MSFISRNHPQQVATRGPLDEVDDRGTPPELFAELSERFGPFTIDVAAAPHNAKCDNYITRAMDPYMHSPWYPTPNGNRPTAIAWCNPPYSDLRAWVKKAWDQWDSGQMKRIVMLVPANRTEQAWWQDWVEPYRDKQNGPLRTEFFRGRTRFIKPGQTEIKANERPPFGCALLIWDLLS